MSTPTETNLDGATTLNMADSASSVVPTGEIKRRLEVDRNESITRFRDIKLIGMGGISEVFSAREPVLNRDIAIKVLRPASRNQLHLVEGFVREARATAQIDHPNIVPVHEMGVFDDAGVYFTMKKVEGETLKSVIARLAAGDREYIRRYSLSRLLEIYIAACQGVAYAHSRGVLHCDLKPANIMLGEYGEVLIMDWGLLRYRAERDIVKKEKLDLDGAMTEFGLGDTEERPDGMLSGTPAFMAPEQIAGGEPDEYTDMYSLGAILYCILTQKNSPFSEGLPVQCVLGLGVRGSFLPPRRRNRKLRIPRELEAICLKAMAHHPSQRYTRVTELIKDVRNFLDNYPVTAYRPVPFYRLVKLCKRRPFIPLSTLVAGLTTFLIFGLLDMDRQIKVDAARDFVDSSIRQGDYYYGQATNKLMAWQQAVAAGDNANRLILERELSWLQAEFENHYQNALDALAQVDPRQGQDRALFEQLVMIFERRLDFALVTGRYDDSLRLLERISRQRYGNDDTAFDDHPRLKRQINMLRSNTGLISLTTSPEEVQVSSVSYDAATGQPSDPVEVMEPAEFALPAGTHVLVLNAPDRPTVYYPLILNPAETLRVNLVIPRELPSGTIYVPEGRLALTTGLNVTPQLAIPGFFIRSGEVTFGEYLEFWKTLETPEEKEDYMAYWQVAPGVSIPCWDGDGVPVEPFTAKDPLVGITGEAALAYCRYLSERTGMTCRLPTENEWQKAAYGIDHRNYVWGDAYIPGAALFADVTPVRTRPELPGAFSMDVSLYGAVDMAGNVRELVMSQEGSPAVFLTKGGSFLTTPSFSRRDFSGTSSGPENDVGFRYVIELPEEP